MKKNLYWIYLLTTVAIITFIVVVLFRVLSAPNTGPKNKTKEPSIPVTIVKQNAQIKEDINQILSKPNSTNTEEYVGTTQNTEKESNSNSETTTFTQNKTGSEESNSEDPLNVELQIDDLSPQSEFPTPVEGTINSLEQNNNDEGPRNTFPEPNSSNPPSGSFPDPVN
ncbi:hypothetical protein [Taylorella equigenitalis]|uniref:Uncharacterized protein n=2 Tax=Taylorella equigenitalis TaxID=29575 RepID=A0A654KF78_TAYEM|nr:hypothetical protein [Taylorella equigenitalis]ADU91060.1 hypothetical protein TEQUI_0104 [Taylorella equigenitalis MCE9]AFN36163.1 putative membrane protein [Taylorella equigenitalis ATCC 35865]ASY39570.1 hypothetical protein CA604_05515 [Taylorella equigenitalis]ASY41073.1 hypothetical protein CAV20_05250 [Taylorella equigenitalis]WDU48929.1 hypothetical protein KNO34_05390 [Taylorella equigenitalis]